MSAQQAQVLKVVPDAPPQRHGGDVIDESGKVDRIRDILFGSQMRDYDDRFQRLDERLAREAADARDDVQKRLEALEGFLKSEVESLRNWLRSEQSERGNAVEKLTRDIAETSRALEMKLNNLDERAGRDVHDLRQQLLEQTAALRNEMRERHDQVQANLGKEAEQIRGAMTGREALSEMLTEVALRLKNEFRVPGV